LILLDLNYPPDVSLTWDGFSILAWLRRLELTKNIPVILFTGQQTNNLSPRAKAAGATGVLSKPLDFPKLVALLEQRLIGPGAAGALPN
jgi:CheY-like chemotaxis protein